MDGTIILTKSGKVHPMDENDWRIGFDTCFKKLKQLCVDHYKLVIFTNQRGLMKATSTDPFRKKIQYIQQKLNVPFQVEISFSYDRILRIVLGLCWYSPRSLSKTMYWIMGPFRIEGKWVLLANEFPFVAVYLV